MEHIYSLQGQMGQALVTVLTSPMLFRGTIEGVLFLP